MQLTHCNANDDFRQLLDVALLPEGQAGTQHEHAENQQICHIIHKQTNVKLDRCMDKQVQDPLYVVDNSKLWLS